MLGGLMMGPIDTDVDLTELEEDDTAAEDEAQEQLLASQNIATPASDVLSGTDLDDVIDAMNGDDQVNGYAGDDLLSGESGDDQMLGGDGNDTLLGESGQDDLHGGFGDDQIQGGDDADNIWGHMGNDTLSGNEGDDTLTGGAGSDTLFGNDGDDGLHGNDGNDSLVGGAGEDVLFGGNGDDHVEGGSDTVRDFLNGGQGDDLLIAQEADVLTGGDGSDTFAIDASAGSFNQSAQIIDFNADEDQIEIMLNEEDYEQGQKNIRIETNDDGSSVVYLNDEEVLIVNSETPLLLKDIMLTTDSNVDLSSLEDTVEVTDGDIQEELPKTRMAEMIPTDNLSETVSVDLGGTPEIDYQINENADAEFLSGSTGDDNLEGGDGNDTLRGGRGEDNLHGGDGDDQIRGGAHTDHLWGDLGDDELKGNNGNDYLDGGTGEDVLFGGNGNDHLEGGSDEVKDFLYGGRGDDLLIAQEADVLTGGEGSDTFAIDTSAGSFEQNAQIIDFNANEDQIEIMLDETNFDQGLKNIRIETNDIGQSVVYLNNETIVAINAETPLSLNDIVLSKANT